MTISTLTNYFSPEFADLRNLKYLRTAHFLRIGTSFGFCTVMFSPIIYVHQTGKFVKPIENVKELFLMVYVY